MKMTTIFQSDQERPDPQQVAAILGHTAESVAMLGAGFKAREGLGVEGQPGQDCCRVDCDGRYFVGAVADGYSATKNPARFAAWVVQEVVVYLGANRTKPPDEPLLREHLNSGLRLRQERIQSTPSPSEHESEHESPEEAACELAAFVYDSKDCKFWLYLFSAPARLPKDGEKPEADRKYPAVFAVLYKSGPSDNHTEASHVWTFVSSSGVESRNTESARGEMRHFDDVEGVLLVTDGFASADPSAPRRDEWPTDVYDGERFRKRITTAADDCSAIFIGNTKKFPEEECRSLLGEVRHIPAREEVLSPLSDPPREAQPSAPQSPVASPQKVGGRARTKSQIMQISALGVVRTSGHRERAGEAPPTRTIAFWAGFGFIVGMVLGVVTGLCFVLVTATQIPQPHPNGGRGAPGGGGAKVQANQGAARS